MFFIFFMKGTASPGKGGAMLFGSPVSICDGDNISTKMTLK